MILIKLIIIKSNISWHCYKLKLLIFVMLKFQSMYLLMCSNFYWNVFAVAATKLLSHEATKFCMLFSKPPLPSPEETQKISDKIESTCFSFVAVFFTLPKSKGNKHKCC